MKELTQILQNINNCIDNYNDLPLEDYKRQSEILRDLTTNLFFLESHRVKSYEDWLRSYYKNEGSNAAREKKADNEIKERYLIKRTMTSAYKVVDSIRSTISIYKKE